VATLYEIVFWPVNAQENPLDFFSFNLFHLSNAKMMEVIHGVDNSALIAKGPILQLVIFILKCKHILCLPTIWTPLSAPALK